MTEPSMICLNVLRHPELPVPRGEETWAQYSDPAFRRTNDDINPERAARQTAAALPKLLLTPGRPLIVRHSPTVRTRKGAALLVAGLPAGVAVTVFEEPALAEPEVHFERVFTREEFEHPERERREAIRRYMRALTADDLGFVGFGRTQIAAHLAYLRDRLAREAEADHLWVSHGLVMPFFYLGLVEGLPPEQWTYERMLDAPRYSYVEGFYLRLPAGE